jgi:hypothetical protein
MPLTNLLIFFLWYDEERKEQWKKLMEHWRKLMEMAGQREAFLDEEIDAFGTQCDAFFELWVDLTGLEGMTNYIHMIGSGYMTNYLREWRNLYRYSQQGWEALNSLLKNIYFRRTQRGSTKEMVSPETASWRQLPNGCSGVYTFYLVHTNTFNNIKKYI